MKRLVALGLALAGGLCSISGAAPTIANPGFEETIVRPPGDPELVKLKKIGWTFTEPIDWPVGWSMSDVSNVTAAISREKPHSGQKCLLLWGQSGSSGYVSAKVSGLTKRNYKICFYGRGGGNATLMTPGVHLVLNRPMTDAWVRCSGIFKNTAGVAETWVSLQAQKAATWFDDLSIEECDALEEMKVYEEASLAGRGALLGAGARVDPAEFAANVNKIAQAIPRLETSAAADPIPANVEAIRRLKTRAGELRRSANPTVEEMNDSICYASICAKLLRDLEFTDAREGE